MGQIELCGSMDAFVMLMRILWKAKTFDLSKRIKRYVKAINYTSSLHANFTDLYTCTYSRCTNVQNYTYMLYII